MNKKLGGKSNAAISTGRCMAEEAEQFRVEIEGSNWPW